MHSVNSQKEVVGQGERKYRNYNIRSKINFSTLYFANNKGDSNCPVIS